MIITRELNRSNLRWLKACILLGALILLPLGLTSAKDPSTVDTISNESTVSDIYKSLPQEVIVKLEEQRKFPGLFLGEIHKLIKIDDLTWLKQSRNSLAIKGVARSNSFDWDQIKNTFPLFQQIEWRYDPIGKEMNQEAIDFHINATLGYYNDEPLEVIPKEILPTFLPGMRDIPPLLRQITYFGFEAGLDIRQVRLKQDIPKDGYSEIPLHMEVTGKYRDIVTFFDALRRMDRFVTLRAIEMHSVEDGSTIMKTSMTIVTYRL